MQEGPTIIQSPAGVAADVRSMSEELQILHLSAPKVQAIVAQGIALGFIRHPYQSPERAA